MQYGHEKRQLELWLNETEVKLHLLETKTPESGILDITFDILLRFRKVVEAMPTSLQLHLHWQEDPEMDGEAQGIAGEMMDAGQRHDAMGLADAFVEMHEAGGFTNDMMDDIIVIKQWEDLLETRLDKTELDEVLEGILDIRENIRHAERALANKDIWGKRHPGDYILGIMRSVTDPMRKACGKFFGKL